MVIRRSGEINSQGKAEYGGGWFDTNTRKRCEALGGRVADVVNMGLVWTGLVEAPAQE